MITVRNDLPPPRPARGEDQQPTGNRTGCTGQNWPYAGRQHDRSVDNVGTPGNGGVPGVNAIVTPVLQPVATGLSKLEL